MIRSAIFSECRTYRYVLERRWSDSLPMVMCIGLNPSTANETDDDPTIKRLISMLSIAGYGGLYMTNLFAKVTPYPRELSACPNPIGDNDQYLAETGIKSDIIIFCWGAFKQAAYREKQIKQMFRAPFCFGQNGNGSPKHPLYLKSDTPIRPYVK